MVNEGLEIKMTDDKGWGVFATATFKKDEKITTYDGHALPFYTYGDGDKISSEMDMDQDVYVILTHQDRVYDIDGKCIYGYTKDEVDKYGSGYGSLINDAHSINEYSHEAVAAYNDHVRTSNDYNCYFKDFVVYANRDIEVGEQLYTPYGAIFWLKHLNDARFNEGYRACTKAQGKTFLEYIEQQYRSYGLREGLNYTPNLLD